VLLIGWKGEGNKKNDEKRDPFARTKIVLLLSFSYGKTQYEGPGTEIRAMIRSLLRGHAWFALEERRTTR